MPPLFEIHSLTYRYADGHAALEDIDLTILEGERVALVGQNGAGKTTLVKHLNGLYRPTSGAVLYQGLPLEGQHLAAARLRMGMLFQDPDDQLFCNTLDEDVSFGPWNQKLNPDQVETRVSSALKRMRLEDLRYKPPHRLSYGQKKRAAFATLLSMQPDVLILDEPTAYLDPKQEKFFTDLLREFPGTLICISHDLPFLYGLCTRAVVLEAGKIHHDFSMRELVSEGDYLRDHGLDFTFRFSCCREDGPGHGHGSAHAAHEPLPVPEISHAESSPRPRAFSQQPLIHLKDYAYRYPDGTRGIEGISLSIGTGESLAVVGENGAGKSTLVSCIAGILQGNGEYSFKGQPMTGKLRKSLWREVGLVFQDPADQLFCPSCAEETAFGLKQLGVPPEEIQARVAEALALVRLEGFERRIPHHLSAGERKRLALATVLAMRPKVLILDEPTANLDPASEEALCEILRGLDVTKILISHDIDIVSLLCRSTLVMHQGRIVRKYLTSDFLHDEHLISVNGLDYTYKNICCREIMNLQSAAR